MKTDMVVATVLGLAALCWLVTMWSVATLAGWLFG